MARVLIRKPGVAKDVQDCNGDELYYSSDWNNWKICKDSSTIGTLGLSVPADNGSNNYGHVDIAHNLGYVPAVEAWIKDGANIFAIPGPDLTVNYNFDIYIDSTKVRVTGADSNATGAKSFTVYFKVYYERIDA